MLFRSEYTKSLKASGDKYPIGDYEWIHSDYQEKSFELTSEEATALINEIAPAFFWFENAQIKILDNGKVEAAGTLLLAKGLNDLYPDLVDQVPFPVFEKVNLAAGGGIGIVENRLTLSADSFMTGPVEGISAEMLNDNAGFFEPLYTSVPGLIIHKLEVTSRGTFQVDALIPQRTEVRRIAP